MKNKKEIAEKEINRQKRVAVNIIYNPDAQTFTDEMRTMFSLPNPFVFREDVNESEYDPPKELLNRIEKFARESLEPENEIEKLACGMKTRVGEISIKEIYQFIGFYYLKLSRKVKKQKLKNVFGDLPLNPTKDIVEYNKNALLEYIVNGKLLPFTPQVAELIVKSELHGEPVIILIAPSIADPDISANKFKEIFLKEFGKKEKKPQNLPRDSWFYEMYRAGNPIKDIADIWMEEHEDEYAEFGTKKYSEQKKKLEALIKTAITRFEERYLDNNK